MVKIEEIFPSFKVEGESIPRVLLGTSPFLGAGQFGVRAYQYYKRFFENPRNITDLVVEVINLGVRGVQLVAYSEIAEAVKQAQTETGVELTVVGSLPFDRPEEGLEALSELRTKIVLIHGEETDRLDFNTLESWFGRIREQGFIPGVATHKPDHTLPELLGSTLDFSVVLLPFNAAGFLMGQREKVISIVSESEKSFIAMKPLAAGRLKPREALEYVFSHRGIDSAAVGVASAGEAKETFSIARDILRRITTH
ncbi:MAG: hypothetical protein ACTSUQ_13470 [Candidatus Freyarchaeota archaeon]